MYAKDHQAATAEKLPVSAIPSWFEGWLDGMKRRCDQGVNFTHPKVGRSYWPSNVPRGLEETPLRVESKRDFYTQYRDGAFGNKPRNWYTLDELEASGFPGTVAILYQVPGSAWMRFHVPIPEVRAQVEAWVSAGATESLFEFSEMLPEHRRLLCGDIWRSDTGLVFYGALGPGGTYREAMSTRAQEFRGLRAHTLLKQSLGPSDWEDLQVLWDRYPDCVVEVSAYECFVGVLAGRNSVFWETRAY